MLDRPTGRILVIDNDPQVRADLQEILEPSGYSVQVAQGVGQDLMNQAITLAYTFRPHVAIIDMRLLDEYSDDRSGLQILNNLKSASCILYSAYLTPELTLQVIRHYGIRRWVSKHQSPQQLVDEVADAVRETCRDDFQLSRPPALSPRRIVEALFGPDTDVPYGLVDDTLRRLFPESKDVALTRLGGEAGSPISVSRGHSVVSKVYPDDLEPVVVKLAPARQTRNEERNYQEYIRGHLVGHFHAHLERVVEFWDLGGATYSFMGSSLSALPSFVAFYREQPDSETILRPLVHFFTEVWSRHYGRRLSKDDGLLFPLYDKALRLKARLERFNYQDGKLTFPELPISLINPIPWALQHVEDSLFPEAHQAITHGDLHGDNLFVDGEHAWAIDFERTGPGHILRDFIELEVDILTRLVPLHSQDLARFYELVFVLTGLSKPDTDPQPLVQWLPDPETLKAFEVIRGLRRMAYEVTRYQDFREYLWGLLLDTVFVATLVSEDSPQRERALLLGGVLCQRLEAW
jgi:CheY-like chemotaxis protein